MNSKAIFPSHISEKLTNRTSYQLYDLDRFITVMDGLLSTERQMLLQTTHDLDKLVKVK